MPNRIMTTEMAIIAIIEQAVRTQYYNGHGMDPTLMSINHSETPRWYDYLADSGRVFIDNYLSDHPCLTRVNLFGQMLILMRLTEAYSHEHK